MKARCRNCTGSGVVLRTGRPPDYVTCPACGGSKTAQPAAPVTGDEFTASAVRDEVEAATAARKPRVAGMLRALERRLLQEGDNDGRATEAKTRRVGHKKPMVDTEIAWGMLSGSPNDLCFTRKRNSLSTVRCVITDARRPTALQAVEKVLQVCWVSHYNQQEIERLSEAAGMTAKIIDGRVKCQWRDE